MSWLHHMVKLPALFAVAIATFGFGLPQGLQAQDPANWAFTPLELRPNDDIDMVLIPAGSFIMGSETNIDEKPPRTVYIRSFLIGKTEVTQKQWLEVMGSNPSRFNACGLGCPVENVSWNDVQEFIAKLNQKTGQKYRLPSEAEWEYAARAGGTTEWPQGTDESKLTNHWYVNNSEGKTQIVGRKLANAFGLFDTYGSVWEWTQDCWHRNYVGAPTDGSAWTTACFGDRRVTRGGSWNDGPSNLRSAFRNWDNPFNRSSVNGFRLAKTLSNP